MTQDKSKPDFSAGPLAGLRVLDLSTMLAGPYAATLLGDLGADVIKIESHYGDESRHLGPKRGDERGPYLSLNRSKRDMVLDLQQPDAQAIFAKIAATADIVVTNVREPAMSKLGINYEQIKKYRPDVIWIWVTSFGADGPYAGRPGIDFLAQGYTGVLTLNGEPKGAPVRTGFPAVDVMTSLLVVNAAQAALRVRDATKDNADNNSDTNSDCHEVYDVHKNCADAIGTVLVTLKINGGCNTVTGRRFCHRHDGK